MLLTGRGVDEAGASPRQRELTGDITVIVDYWAEWCGLRRRPTPAFGRSHKFEGKLRFAKLAVDANPPKPSGNGGCGTAATCHVRPGRDDAAIVGSMPADRRRAVLEQRLQAA